MALATRPPRRGRTGSPIRAALAVAALLTGLSLLTGCSGVARGGTDSAGSAGSPGAAGSPGGAPAVTGSPAATTALETSADQVRAQVDTLAQSVQARSSGRQLIINDAGPCTLGEPGAWPQRWGYVVVLTVRDTDPTRDAGTLRNRLSAEGWTVRAYDSTVDSVDFDARKDGVLLRVSGEPNPARVTVEGYGRCISADGTPEQS